MQAHYEINVSLNGRHFFATAPRSFVYAGDETKLEEARKVFADKFPESEGYKITVMLWQGSGTVV